MFPRVLLEVNVAGEASKFGFSPEKLRAQMEELLALERLQIEGLMTIPPFAPEAEEFAPALRRAARIARAAADGIPRPAARGSRWA